MIETRPLLLLQSLLSFVYSTTATSTLVEVTERKIDQYQQWCTPVLSTNYLS